MTLRLCTRSTLPYNAKEILHPPENAIVYVLRHHDNIYNEFHKLSLLSKHVSFRKILTGNLPLLALMRPCNIRTSL